MLVLRKAGVKIATGINFQADPTGLTPADVFYNPTNPHYSQVDKNRWTVVKDRLWHVSAQTEPGTLLHPGHTTIKRNMIIPWGRNLVFDTDTATSSLSFLKGSEQYLVFVASFAAGTNSGERVGTLDVSSQFHFKDA